MASKREQELEDIVRQLAPAVRDVIWCAIVWNDHNFDVGALLRKAQSAADSLKLQRYKAIEQRRDCVEEVNAWLARIDKALGSKSN